MRQSLAALLLLSAGTAYGAGSGSLQYRFQSGQTYSYDVKIVAELPDETQTLSGVSRYTVKAVDAQSGQMTLTQSATLMMKHDAKQTSRSVGRFPRPPRMGRPMFDLSSYNSPSELVVDPSGKVVRYQRKTQLPFLLGNSWGLVIEPLPADGQTQWQVAQDAEITETEASSFSPFHAAQGVNRAASEKVDYALAGNDGKVATLRRTYDLRTQDKVDNEPSLEQSGTGELHFDVAGGVMRDVDEKYTLQVSQPGVTVKIPVTVTARLLTPEEAAKFDEERKQAVAKLKAEVAERERPKAIDEATLGKYLAEMKKSTSETISAEEDLARALPIESRRPGVAALLAERLEDRNSMVASAAAKALKTWGTRKQVSALIKALDSRDLFVRHNAMGALAASKDPRAAAAIAPRLVELTDQMEAGRALEAIGPDAERDVQPILKDREWTVRLAAAEVLAKIGTDASTAALKAVADQDSNGLVQLKAQDALKAIASRRADGAAK